MQTKLMRAMTLFVVILITDSAVSFLASVWQFSDHNLPQSDTADFVPGALWLSCLPYLFMGAAFFVVLRALDQTIEANESNEQISQFQYSFVIAATATFSSVASQTLFDFNSWFTADVSLEFTLAGFVLPTLAMSIGLCLILLQLYAWSGYHRLLRTAARNPKDLLWSRQLSLTLPVLAIWFGSSAVLLSRVLNNHSIDWATLGMVLALVLILVAVAQRAYLQAKAQIEYAEDVLDSREDDSVEWDESPSQEKQQKRARFVYGLLFAISILAFEFTRDGFNTQLWSLTHISKSKWPETLFELTDTNWWLTVGVENLALIPLTAALTLLTFKRWVFGVNPVGNSMNTESVGVESGVRE